MTLRKTLLCVIATAVLVVVGISGHSATVSQAQQAATPPAVTDWQISQKTTTENGQKPDYVITISKPTLETNGTAFNKAVDDFLAATTGDFKKTIAEPNTSPITAPSTLTINYNVFATNSGLISVRFNAAYYVQGAAHPASYSHTLNYDLNTGKVLTLADLFKPNSKYLETIAKFCSDELKRENRLTFPDGATAKAENYANWTIDHGGLLITFDDGQVGSHAEGPSNVFVPYYVLADLLRDETQLIFF